MSTIRYRSDIQGLRAFAVFVAIAFHVNAPFASGGFVGVDVFFVISGYLITELMLRDHASDQSVATQLGQFYARRARRIIPAAMLVIAATLAFSALTDNPLTQIWRAQDGIASALFYANTQFVNAAGALTVSRPSPLGHYWSLAVEEQFYVFWPLLFMGICAVAGRRQRLALGVFIVAVSSVSFVLALQWTSEPTGPVLNVARAFCLLQARAWQLGVGALLAVASGAFVHLALPLRRAFQWIGIVAILLAFAVYGSSTIYPGWSTLVPTLGTAILIAGGIGTPAAGLVDKALSIRLLQVMGRYSYSMYLWHLPLYFYVVLARVDGWALQLVALMIVTTAAAAVTYHVFEQPIRDARFLRAHPPLWSIGVGAAFSAAVVVAGLIVVQRGEDGVRTNFAAADGAVPTRVRPQLIDVKSDKYFRPARQRDVERPRRIALVGDSHAEHLIPGMDRAADELGARLDTYVLRRCPAFTPAPPKVKSACDDFRSETLEELRRTSPDLIVLSTTGPVVGATEAAFKAAPRALRTYLEIAPVVVVSLTPMTDRDTPACVAAHLRTPQACAVQWPAAANALYGSVAERAGATFVDLRDELCVDLACPPILDDRLVWADGEHLTPQFATSLAPWLVGQLEPHFRR